eukprot:TRINITY_DN1238_c0_g1_i1.p1 TRINITY_DN1238_c0_g1~~TRINITY_DN1238_c0_g1_i1.p1  ORF type:complete len:612 (-),score=97.18 TRINITY_DN1238_c0_g1_i1:36-1871(-)
MLSKALLLFLVSVWLVNGATIRWTSAGGNPLWTEPNNWDLARVPTSADDVIIDVPNIRGNVITTATPSYAKSVTVGGTSGTIQTLNVQGPLYMQSGQIMGNGALVLNSGPDLSLSVSGTFSGGSSNQFSFISGALGGPGKYNFVMLNMTGSAEKRINSTVSVSNTLTLSPGRGNTGSINIVGGSLSVSGTFKTTDPLILASSAGAAFDVSGTFQYAASSASYAATIRGTANIANLDVAAGTVILADDTSVTSATVNSGATLDLIGADASTRKIGDITGSGLLKIEGGTNTFSTLTSIGNVNLMGGTLSVLTKAATINDLMFTNGYLEGPAPLHVTTGTFSNAQIMNLPLTVSVYTQTGFTALKSSSVTISQNGIISQNCQLALGPGSTFSVASTGVVSQSAGLEIVKTSMNTPAPSFNNDGKWTTTAPLSILIATTGSGVFQLASGSMVTLTGIQFATGSIVSTASTLTAVGADVTVGSISGSGTFQAQGNTFTVTGTLNCQSFVQTNGVTNIGTGVISALDLQTGSFTINGPAPPTGALLSVATFTFEGGSMSSISKTAPVAVTSFTLSGVQPKTLSNVSVTAGTLTLDCGSQQCQLFTQDAHLSSGSKQ